MEIYRFSPMKHFKTGILNRNIEHENVQYFRVITRGVPRHPRYIQFGKKKLQWNLYIIVPHGESKIAPERLRG